MVPIGSKISAVNQNGRLPIRLRVWVKRVFCTSGHDRYAYRMSCVYVYEGGETSSLKSCGWQGFWGMFRPRNMRFCRQTNILNLQKQ